MVGASGIEVPNCDHLVGARSPCKGTSRIDAM